MKKSVYITSLGLVLSGAFVLSNLDNQTPESETKQTRLEQKIAAKKAKKKGRLYSEGLESRFSERNRDALRRENITKLANPVTGEIPANMRAKELEFAKSLPAFSAAVEFEHRGPFNVGGRTRAFATDVNNSQTLIAGGISGGIWKSTDGGATWQKKTASDQFGSVTCIAQDKRPGKTHIWYYGTGEGYGNSAGSIGAYYFGNGMFKSEDNGESWTPIASTTTDETTNFNTFWQVMWNVAVDNSVDTLDIVYAAIYDGIHRSTDGGDTWTQVLGTDGSTSAYTTNIMVTPTGITYAFLNSDATGSERGLWRSDDHGATWSNITPSDFPGTFERGVLDYNPSDENEVYVFMNTPNFGKQTNTFFDGEDWNSLWKYTYDSANTTSTQGTWEDLSDNLPDDGTGFATLYTQSGYDMVVKVHPTLSDVVYIGGTNLYRSDDGFSTDQNVHNIGGYNPTSVDTNWAITDGYHPDQHFIYFHDGDTTEMYSINDGGIFKTTDPLSDTQNWISLNNGYFTTQLYAVGINQNNVTNTIIGGFQDNGNFVTKSNNFTDDWVMPYNGDGAFSYVNGAEDYYYLSIQRGRVGKFTLDSQGNRTGYQRVDPAGIDRDGVKFIHPFAVDPNDEDYMYYPVDDTLYRQSSLSTIPLNESINAWADNWDYIEDGINLSGSNTITAVHVTKNNPKHRVYLGSSQRHLFKIDSANTANPVVTKMGYKDADGNIAYYTGNTSCITSNPNNGDEVITVLSNYEANSLAHSLDGGETWQNISGNLEEEPNGDGNGPSTRWASIMPLNNGETLYLVGTSVGLFGTTGLNGPSTVWYQISPDKIGNVVVEQVITRPEDGLILVATHGNGIYSANITSVSDIIGLDEEVEESDILSIDKNPSNGNLYYTWNGETVDVMNVLVHEMSTGKHIQTRVTTSNNGSNFEDLNLEQGRYILTFKFNGKTITKKLFVL